MSKIVIIDYGISNLTSVANAFSYLGEKTIISNKAQDIKDAEKIILPGVGAFGDGMKNLKELGLIEVLNEEVIKNGKPLLGLCLGMQLLADEGEEGGLIKGLGYIQGKVKKLEPKDKNLRVPHIGWNDVFLKKDCPLLSGLKEYEDFYFVHSYHLVPEEDVTVGTCEYGEKFVAVVQKNNIFATQFHPEKSQRPGLKILKNFIKYKKC